MCTPCWKMAENRRDPFPKKPQAEPQISRIARMPDAGNPQSATCPGEAGIRNPQLKEEGREMPKTKPCDWEALFADARAGISISVLQRKHGPAWETIHKRLLAAGITPAKGVSGRAAKAESRRPKVQTALAVVAARPRPAGGTPALPGAPRGANVTVLFVQGSGAESISALSAVVQQAIEKLAR
jgi:hypothetical protein